MMLIRDDVMLTRDDRFRPRTRVTGAPDVGDADITNQLEEALEEGAADRSLTLIVEALGLLLASLPSPPKEPRLIYAEREASASRTR